MQQHAGVRAQTAWIRLLFNRTDVYVTVMHDKVTNISGETGLAAGLSHRFRG